MGLLSLVFLVALPVLFFHDAGSPSGKYIEGLIDYMRPALLAISCLLIGGIHFIGILGQEPVYLQIGFMVLILAYFETASFSITFRAHYVGGMSEVTAGTVQRLYIGMVGRLGMVLVLSVLMLYLSLLVVVGFVGPFSAAFLAALMILAIGFMALIRRL